MGVRGQGGVRMQGPTVSARFPTQEPENIVVQASPSRAKGEALLGNVRLLVLAVLSARDP
jgi:hypothetical protein